MAEVTGAVRTISSRESPLAVGVKQVELLKQATVVPPARRNSAI
jgi:hypothetical protein